MSLPSWRRFLNGPKVGTYSHYYLLSLIEFCFRDAVFVLIHAAINVQQPYLSHSEQNKIVLSIYQAILIFETRELLT